MKRLIFLSPSLLLLMLFLASCSQSAEKLNNDGNEAFATQDFEGSLVAYQQAGIEAPELAEPHYNAANSHYRLEDFEQAQREIEQALLGEESQEDLDQNSFYNLGNTFFKAEQFEMAVEAYKEALRLNPDDLEAKQNLELALRQLKQQQQEKENKDQQNQDQQDQQNQDQQDQQNQEQQDQQNQEQQDQQNQEQQDQQNQQNEQNQGQANQPKEQEQNGQASIQPQQTAGLSEEQARQLLAAAAQGTESLEEFLQQILVFPGTPPLEDW
jgi:tetratricopeptide (TPR) repeat protein